MLLAFKRRLRHATLRIPISAKKLILNVLPDSLLMWYETQDVDVYIISYPKCGRTWLRLMIGKAIQQHFLLDADTDLIEISQLSKINPMIPKIKVSHDDKPHFKTPIQLEKDKSQFQHKRIVFLTRDPRDVIVSYYFHVTRRFQIETTSISDFIRQDIGGINTLIFYYNIWAESQSQIDHFLRVRYEDLHANPQAELRRVLSFIGLPEISPQVITQAVQYAAFDNMRKLEESNAFSSPKLQPGQMGEYTSYKTRKGKIGSYFDHLTDSDIEYLNQKIDAELSNYYSCYKEFPL